MKMSERSQKYKGKYRPQNPEKYMGDNRNIIYRSMWERKCMKYFDNNPSIIKWASEELAIPYYDSLGKRVRNYYPTFSSRSRIKKVYKRLTLSKSNHLRI